MATSTTTALPSAPTTRLAAESVSIGELPGDFTHVLSTEHGLFVAAPSAPGGPPPLRRVTSQPASAGFGVGAGRIVYQEAHDEGTGGIVVLDDKAEHKVIPAVEMHGGERHFRLRDAGMVSGRPVAVITSAYDERGPDDEDDAHLISLNLDTLEQTDLGSAAGWEERVHGVRLLSDGDVIIHRVGTGGEALERRRTDGTTVWSIDLPDDGSTVLATAPSGRDAPPHALLVRHRHFDEIDGPDLVVHRFDLRDGTQLEPIPVFLHRPHSKPTPSPCSRVEADLVSLLCAQSDGQTLQIALADGTTVRAVDLPEQKGLSPVVTTWRR